MFVSNSGVAVVIEDDTDIRALVSQVLEQAGFLVYAASSGVEGLDLIREYQPVVTTLDVSMPGIDGFETAKRIREVSDTYIVMLTARADEIDTLQGLQAGADDYVTKPFRPRELRARIEAMMRRPRSTTHATVVPIESAPSAVSAASTANPPSPPEPDDSDGWYEHRGLRLHPEMRIATVDGSDVELTRSEFDIMADLLSAGRRVVGKDDLALMLRGERYAGGSGFVSEHDVRAIEVHVANLRRKLGESAASPRWIETIRGVGYRLTSA
ncbi:MULTISPECIES: response regulator transcription factor [unclassified Microbacterium]|uniref:response regulator transcription factor n=1 Tax=unclassified Microbacterium TaxID=2609290 RepID=UPI000C2C8B15